ncbi:MAG: radical SAM protein [Ruminococcus sp.]|jgi:molybdenum cofactor biosynthesis enzyme MoaA|nr:radical SAM protein [Ruminococcus sp.]
MKKLNPEKQSIYLRASVSDRCNFACVYCAFDLGMENHTPVNIVAPLLSIEDYVKNLKLIADRGFKNVSFTGGEPFCNPNFPEILKRCRDFFEIIEVTTNGTKLLDNINCLEYIDSLKISIDAMNPNLSFSITKNRESARVPEIIEELCRRGIKHIGLNFVYMKMNRNELAPIINFARELNEKYSADVQLRVLDLYRSKGTENFWKEQFVPLKTVREELIAAGTEVKRRVRIGCDSYNYEAAGVIVNMKDSITSTTRADICDNCPEFCQEGIYSLKHSASGWISVCPSNSESLGRLISAETNEEVAPDDIDYFIDVINKCESVTQTV